MHEIERNFKFLLVEVERQIGKIRQNGRRVRIRMLSPYSCLYLNQAVQNKLNRSATRISRS